MLDPVFVSTLIGAGITGAGLILAVYALILPIMRRVLVDRAKKYMREIKEVKEKAKQIGSETVDYTELRDKLSKIESMEEIPNYLKWGAGGTFSLFILTTIMSVAWFIDWNKYYGYQSSINIYICINFILNCWYFGY
jgi:hypothetical protein